jgi:PAS domain S-box-containing protein
LKGKNKRKQTEEAPRESEERLRAQYRGIPVPTYTWQRVGEDFVLVDYNDAAMKITHGNVANYLGRKASEMYKDRPKIQKELSRCFNKKITIKREMQYQFMSTGENKFLDVSYVFISPDLVSVHTEDITEHKKAEEALQESEERFRSVVENSHDGVLIVDDNFRLVYANDELCHIFGYSKEEIVGQDFRKFLSEGTIPLCQDMYLRRQRGEKVSSPYELKMIRKDGEKICIEIKSTILRDNKSKVQTVVQILDVTKQKRMEEERKRYEGRLSALNLYSGKLNIASSLGQVYDLTLDAMEKTLGFEDATFMIIEKGHLKVACQRGYSKTIRLELPLDGTKKGITVRAVNTRKPILVPSVEKDKDYVEGVPSILSELAVPVIIEDKVLGVLDVESRKLGAFDEKDTVLLQILASHAATAISNLMERVEVEKRSSQLALLMKSSAEIIHSTNLRKRLQTTAEAIQELGWQRVVISARDENLDITNPEDIVTAGLTEEERKFLWTNRQPGQVWRERLGLEYERFKIGEFYHLPWSDPWVRKRFSEGTVPSKLSPEEMVDWDPQDLLYAPLRLADGRTVGVVSIDDPLDGKRPTKESLAPLGLFLHQAAVAIENAKLIQQLNEAKKQIKGYADQLELKVKQRTRELMEAQNKLLKSERLAAIGEIAAMVGHDLRNPLTGIANAAYYLKMKTGSKMDKKTKEMLNLLEEDVGYSNKIINDLLEYSREIQLELTETTPKIITKEALSLVKIPENIHVVDSTQTEPKIKIDREKMKRAFVNIIKNAFDAMPKGGTLTIKSGKTDSSLKIAFMDTGAGMRKEILDKVFIPLFTTKARGMGFGLAICKRFVEAHGGHISVESSVGKGTTFTVTIPVQSKLEGGEKIWVSMPESLLSTTTKA